MAVSLPVKMAEAKESSSCFFIELYKLLLPSYTLTIASCDEDIFYNGETYKAFPVKRGEITKTVDSRVDNCEIEISNTNEYFTLALFNGKNFLNCRALIYKILYPDALDDPTNVQLIFYGQIDTPELTENGTFKCSIISDLPNMDACRTMGYSCTNTFGDENCQKKPDEMMGVGTLENRTWQGISRQCLVDSRLADGNWENGVCEIDGEARRIIHCETGCVFLEYAFPSNIDLSDGYWVRQNCDKTQASCKKLGNLKNYGGFPFVPFEYNVKS